MILVPSIFFSLEVRITLVVEDIGRPDKTNWSSICPTSPRNTPLELCICQLYGILRCDAKTIEYC